MPPNPSRCAAPIEVTTRTSAGAMSMPGSKLSAPGRGRAPSSAVLVPRTNVLPAAVAAVTMSAPYSPGAVSRASDVGSGTVTTAKNWPRHIS